VASGPVERTADGVRVQIRLTPKAARSGVQGRAAEADGRVVVKVRVTAPPEGGKANAALVRLLARDWGIAKSAVAIAAGATDRRKTLAVSGDPDALGPALEAWAAALPEA